MGIKFGKEGKMQCVTSMEDVRNMDKILRYT